MTTRQLLIDALEGRTPERTPLSLYNWMMDDPADPRWRRLLDAGLGVCQHCETLLERIEHGVVDTVEEEVRDGRRHRVDLKQTPVGTLRATFVDNWQQEHWIKCPEDYNVRRWIVEHTELVPRYEEFEKSEAIVGDYGVTVIRGSRTPAMDINVDWAGTERFCTDVALELPELFDLYEAERHLFLEECKLIAAGPGRYVKWFENLTIGMIGPRRYGELLVPIYREAIPILTAGGKRVMVHYDGALRVIADQIAAAPLPIIESLTEPPEGDMTYDECRRAWPDKVFWANVNVDLPYRPAEELHEAIAAKLQRAGRRAFALEISEDLPTNWEQSIPVMLRTLEELS